MKKVIRKIEKEIEKKELQIRLLTESIAFTTGDSSQEYWILEKAYADLQLEELNKKLAFNA